MDKEQLTTDITYKHYSQNFLIELFHPLFQSFIIGGFAVMDQGCVPLGKGLGVHLLDHGANG